MLNFYDSDKAHDHKTLKSSRTPFDGEMSWNPTIVDYFVNVVQKRIKSDYPESDVSYSLKKDKKYQWEFTISVQYKAFIKKLDLKVEFIKSPKCPKDLPIQIGDKFKEFIRNFNNSQKRKGKK